MENSKYRIIGTNSLESIVNYLKEELTFEYENRSENMCVLISEEYYFRNNSTQLNMVIVKLVDSEISIDIIGAAGGVGLLRINWGSESGYLKRVLFALEQYSKENDFELEEIITKAE